MASRRQERVAKRIVQELVDAFRNLKHVVLGFVSIARCDISPDLRHAKVFVSFFDSDEKAKKGLHFLQNHAGKLRGMIARPLGIKYTPELQFEFDDTLATADEISRLIRDARATDPNPLPLTEEEEAALRRDTAEKKSEKPAVDQFDAARMEVEKDLYGLDDDDDPDWKPINLDELPDDDKD